MARKPAAAAQSTIPSDLMLKISAKARELRDAELTKDDLSERVSSLSKRIYDIEHEELPNLVMETGLDSIGIPAEGNQPAYDLKLKPFYAASIAASWPDEQKAAAFSYLEEKGAGDLIKTEIKISVPKEHRAKVQSLIDKINAAVDELEIAVDIEAKAAVHHGTLTSWLKEVSEEGEDIDLERIGGKVGQIVKPKVRK